MSVRYHATAPVVLNLLYLCSFRTKTARVVSPWLTCSESVIRISFLPQTCASLFLKKEVFTHLLLSILYC